MTALVVGDVVEPLVIDGVQTGPMKVFALLMQDPNPIHWDHAAVAALGLGPRVVSQGRLNVSWLAEVAARAASGHANVRRLTARFVGQVHEGDTVTCSGTVVAVEGDTITLELVAAVEGEPRVTATAVLSARSQP